MDMRTGILIGIAWALFAALSAQAADSPGLPAPVYDYFRAADEAAKAGDAAAFREAVVAAAGGVGNYTISPDGRKAFVGAGDRFDEYFDADMWEEPVFYFEVGRGLVSFDIKRASYANAAWSADARYCAYTASMEGQPATLYVADTEVGKDVSLGAVAPRGIRNSFAFEGRYLVWLGVEEREGEPPLWVPGLRAYDLKAERELEILKADMSTLEPPGGAAPSGRVKLVPAGKVPEKLKGCDLYKYYKGTFVDCRTFGM
jgi:hypothetical protein